MNCTRITPLLPLYASADLPAPQLAQVSAHLAQCESCAASAAEFISTRAWLREVAAPEFDETFYAELRYAVRQELAAQPARAAWRTLQWKPLAVAAALLLLTIFSLRLFQTKGVPPTDIVKTPASPQLPDAGRTPMLPANVFAQTQKVIQPLRNVWRQRVRTVPKLETAPEEVAMAEPANVPELPPAANVVEPEMLRIEMQTADPSIRIIWLAPKAGSLTR